MRNCRSLLATPSLAAFAVALLASAVAQPLAAQSTAAQAASQPATPEWQIDAGSKMAFDVASVKPDRVTPSGETSRSNVPLGPMDDFRPSGGLFSATDVSLLGYIMFAYKLEAFQTKPLYDSLLPEWATKTMGFDIEAHAPANMNPTKDQFRLMMQALLADRFKLAVHYETKQMPVFALVVDKPGKLGPKIQHHLGDEPCSADPGSSYPPVTTAAGYPQICGFLTNWFDGRRFYFGGRNIDLQAVASAITGVVFGIDRPVLDRTGLTGTYDLVFNFTSENMPPGIQLDESGPTFLEALKDQLGLKLVPETGRSMSW